MHFRRGAKDRLDQHSSNLSTGSSIAAALVFTLLRIAISWIGLSIPMEMCSPISLENLNDSTRTGLLWRRNSGSPRYCRIDEPTRERDTIRSITQPEQKILSQPS